MVWMPRNACQGSYAEGLTATRAGKQWHAPRKAFRPVSGLTSYAQRQKERQEMAIVKAREREMKAEKEEQRQVGFFSHRRRLNSVPSDHCHKKLT